ncbi:MAG TPA: D-alanyl-D-alanine endopeptidase [Burkholderiales bacterium]
MLVRWLTLCLVFLGTLASAGAAQAATHPAKAKAKHVKPAKPVKAVKRAHIRHVAVVDNGELSVQSNIALVVDQSTGRTVFGKNVDEVHPIASISKLMTAQVILDAQLPMEERVTITEADVDTEKGTRSRLRVGTELTRTQLLQLALMSSENRAAHALARTYPEGLQAFVLLMNQKAKALGMTNSHFVEPTGLSSSNVSTASDLVKLVHAAERYTVIREYTTTSSRDVEVMGRVMRFNNTNRLVGSEAWDIVLSKTGFINEAGRCLVMQARIEGRPLTIVLLDSWGRMTRLGDANRIRKWLTSQASAGGNHMFPTGEAAGG